MKEKQSCVYNSVQGQRPKKFLIILTEDVKLQGLSMFVIFFLEIGTYIQIWKNNLHNTINKVMRLDE